MVTTFKWRIVTNKYLKKEKKNMKFKLAKIKSIQKSIITKKKKERKEEKKYEE